jgi:hypothetical protein
MNLVEVEVSFVMAWNHLNRVDGMLVIGRKASLGHLPEVIDVDDARRSESSRIAYEERHFSESAGRR